MMSMLYSMHVDWVCVAAYINFGVMARWLMLVMHI